MYQQPQQLPPPYEPTPSTSAGYTTPAYNSPVPPKPGAPMQAAYVANPGYPQGGTTTTTTTFVQQQPAVILTPGLIYRDVPVSMKCPTCNTQIVTATEFYPGSMSWLACFGLAAVGCVFGCCLIPFCVDDMKDVTHSCPNCRTVLGVYRRW